MKAVSYTHLDRHALGIKILDFNMLFAKADAVRGDRIAEVLDVYKRQSTNKPGVKEARERFVQVQGHLLSAFSALECAVTPLDNRARLEVLHKFFRISEEGRFNFEFDNCAKLGQDFQMCIRDRSSH